MFVIVIEIKRNEETGHLLEAASNMKHKMKKKRP